MSLFAHKDLSRKRTKFSLAHIRDDSGWGISNFLMRQDYCRRNVGRDVFALGRGAASLFCERWVGWSVADGSSGIFIPDIAVRVALKGTGFYPFQRTGSVPCSLIISVKYVSFRIESDSTR